MLDTRGLLTLDLQRRIRQQQSTGTAICHQEISLPPPAPPVPPFFFLLTPQSFPARPHKIARNFPPKLQRKSSSGSVHGPSVPERTQAGQSCLRIQRLAPITRPCRLRRRSISTTGSARVMTLPQPPLLFFYVSLSLRLDSASFNSAEVGCEGPANHFDSSPTCLQPPL